MTTEEQIDRYIDSQPEPKRSDLQALHRTILQAMPACRLGFLDGRNDEGRTVSNPIVGYGLCTMKYADGKTREFYRVGMSANTTGISVYLMGIEDRNHLARAYGKRLGKASVSGYCIKFRALKDLDLDVLEEAVRYAGEGNNGDVPS